MDLFAQGDELVAYPGERLMLSGERLALDEVDALVELGQFSQQRTVEGDLAVHERSAKLSYESLQQAKPGSFGYGQPKFRVLDGRFARGGSRLGRAWDHGGGLPMKLGIWKHRLGRSLWLITLSLATGSS